MIKYTLFIHCMILTSLYAMDQENTLTLHTTCNPQQIKAGFSLLYQMLDNACPRSSSWTEIQEQTLRNKRNEYEAHIIKNPGLTYALVQDAKASNIGFIACHPDFTDKRRLIIAALCTSSPGNAEVINELLDFAKQKHPEAKSMWMASLKQNPLNPVLKACGFYYGIFVQGFQFIPALEKVITDEEIAQ